MMYALKKATLEMLDTSLQIGKSLTNPAIRFLFEIVIPNIIVNIFTGKKKDL